MHHKLVADQFKLRRYGCMVSVAESGTKSSWVGFTNRGDAGATDTGQPWRWGCASYGQRV
jgi:hypothetical protein